VAGRKLVVEVAADISQYIKGLSQASSATKKLDVSVSELNVDTKKLTETAVRASVKRAERLEKEVAGYRQLAAVAVKGSREQIAATNLAAQSERKLASSFAVVGVEARQASRHTSRLGRDVDHAARGALSGSGLFHSFGRSLAFASGGFIAFHEASDFIRESINAAREAIVAQRSLAAQMKASGESFEANRERIEKVALSYGKFGFQNDEVIQSLTVLERGTGNINKAISLQGLTADLARAKNKGLAEEAAVVAKVFGGQETALRRAVPGLSKNAHGWDLIREAQKKLAGQAAANTTASEQFASTLHDTEEIIGTGLLPTLNQYLGSLSEWLQKMNESGKLQRDVGAAADILRSAVGAVNKVFDTLNHVTGSTKQTLKLLLEVFVAYKTLNIISSLKDIATNIGLIGRKAKVAAGESAALRGELGLLGGINPIVIPITLAIAAEQAGHGDPLGIGNILKKHDLVGLLTGRKGFLYDLFAGKAKGPSGQGALDKLLEGMRKSAAAPNTKSVDLRTAGGIVVDTKPPTVEQRNAAFDAMISRQLGRVQDISTVQGQIARLQQIASLIEKRRAVTNDITRRLKLEDNLLAVFREIKSDRLQLQQDAIDALSLDVARAGLTKSLSDDIAALQVVNAKLAQQNRLYGTTNDRMQQIIGNEQTIQEKREQQRQNAQEAAQKAAARAAARQFRLLGLGAEGDDLIPGVGNLRKRLKSLRATIAGSSLDTRATQQTIKHIGQVLSGAFGAVGDQVRSKIDEIFKGWSDELKKGRDDLATKFRPVDANKFIAGLGLGLTPDQVKRLRAGIVTLGPHATAPTHHTGAFALAGGVTVNGGVHLHGVQDMSRFEAELQKRAHGRPHPRRGAR
jgi:hypothetical protein